LTFVNSDGGAPKLQKAISSLLIIGVVISLVLEIIGMVLFFHSYGHLHLLQGKAMFIRGQNFFSFLYGLLQGHYPQKSAILFMTLGITTLILTPYARVVVSVLYFAWKRNIKYTLITVFVLTVLTISLALH
jgi:uncharacterized membrane protein